MFPESCYTCGGDVEVWTSFSTGTCLSVACGCDGSVCRRVVARSAGVTIGWRSTYSSRVYPETNVYYGEFPNQFPRTQSRRTLFFLIPLHAAGLHSSRPRPHSIRMLLSRWSMMTIDRSRSLRIFIYMAPRCRTLRRQGLFYPAADHAWPG